MSKFIKIILALALVISTSASKCATESGSTGSDIKRPHIMRDVTFWANWEGGIWMDITLIYDGNMKGPYEKREGFNRTESIAVGVHVEFLVIKHKDQPDPKGGVGCLISLANATVLEPNGRGHGTSACRAYGDIPMPPTQG